MNIKTQELMLVKKNMKFGETKPESTNTPTTESPVTKPETSMSALEAKAQNNVAFQGVQLPMNVQKGLTKIMLLAALGGGAAVATTSCTDVDQKVTVDMAAIVAVMNEMMAIQKDLLEQAKINNQQNTELNAKLEALKSLYEQGLIDTKEFRVEFFETMAEMMIKLDDINANLEANGKTQEEIKDILEGIDKKVNKIKLKLKKGEISFTQAMTEITKYLESIDSSVKDLLDIKDILNEISGKLDISNDKLDALNKESNKLNEQVNNGIISADKAREQFFAYMVESLANQKDILAQLKQNGLTDKEALEAANKANEQLNDIKNQLAAGDITFEEAVGKLTEIMSGISEKLDSILAELKNIAKQQVESHKAYMEGKNEVLDMLGKLYFQGKIDQSYFEDMFQTQQAMKQDLADIRAVNKEILNTLNDEEKYNKFIEDLKALDKDDINYQNLENLFKMYGYQNLEEVINTTRKDILGAMNQYQNEDMMFEEKQTALLSSIHSKLDYIADHLGGVPQTGIEEALKELKDAVDKNTGAVDKNSEIVNEQLTNVNAKLDKLMEKMDLVIDNTSGLAEHFADAKVFFDNAAGSLAGIEANIDTIKVNQKVTNENLDDIKADLKDLKTTAKNIEGQLPAMKQAIIDVENAIKDLDLDCDAMTRDEFVEALAERDEQRDTNIAKFVKQMINDYGFDKVPGDVQTIKEFLADIKDAVENREDITGHLNTIISLEAQILDMLKNANFSSPDYSAQLKTILEAIQNLKLECNCECSCNGDTGKSDESVEDLEDLFGKKNG